MPPPFSLCLPAWTTLQSVRQSPESDLAFAARSLCCHSSVLMLHLKTSTGIATRVSHVSPQLRNLQKLRTGQSCPYCTHQSRCLITDFDWQWLAQDSDLLTIRSGQENSFSNAHADLNNVLNSIESAWTFLKADNETLFDVILEEDVTDMEEEMEEDLDTDIDEFLADARKVLNEDNTVTFTI